MEQVYDLAVIGGGINGTGIARDAAGRGLKVVLCEQSDLASGTSSASTKLIHGGLRYLEYFHFRMVREALAEREVLLAAAPHIIRPLRFVLPHRPGLRPAWLIRLGLFLYDHLGGRKRLAGSRRLALKGDAAGEPLKPTYTTGFEYSDCWVDDARLVVLNARDAADRGALILTRTACMGGERTADGWRLRLAGPGGERVIAAKVLINAAGPWLEQVASRLAGIGKPARVRLVKGSHIVVPRVFSHDRAYIFQTDDGRVAFAIPYEGDFTLIGTTDMDFTGDPATVAITPDEVGYLCRAVNAYFARPIGKGDVVHAYAGVRSLYDDGSRDLKAVTRDYLLDVDAPAASAPLLSVIGGKITTFRRLAEAVFAKLAPFFPAMGPAWTAGSPLPGGDFPVGTTHELVRQLVAACRGLDQQIALRLATAYGTRARRALGEAREVSELGRHFGHGLYESEVAYLVAEEWAASADDILWRRSKLGLRFTAAEKRALAAWLDKAPAHAVDGRAS